VKISSIILVGFVLAFGSIAQAKSLSRKPAATMLKCVKKTHICEFSENMTYELYGQSQVSVGLGGLECDGKLSKTQYHFTTTTSGCPMTMALLADTGEVRLSSSDGCVEYYNQCQDIAPEPDRQ
jgi:hypothetical protein